MQTVIKTSLWYWIAFIGCILIFLALDLGLFHRRGRVVRFKEALGWTTAWFALAMLFAGGLAAFRSQHEAVAFCTGYFLEISLSMDNVFVIALIFSYFKVPGQFQHRVLFWGIVGALLMRGLMIWAGVALIARFEWILYVFGGFIILTGLKMLQSKEAGVEPEKNPVVRALRGIFPISPQFDGQKLMTSVNGRRMLTPLFVVLTLVETTDLLFAVDSIPAIFGVTRQSFIVFTSNVFAILGLRSLYFVLAGAISYFRFLKIGISGALVFIGAKMLLDPHDKPPQWWQWDIPDWLSLVVVIGIIGTSLCLSLVAARREKK